MLKIEQPMFAR